MYPSYTAVSILTANNLLTGFNFWIIASTDQTANLCKSPVLHPAVSHTSCNITFKTKDSITAILKALKHYYTFHVFLIKCRYIHCFPWGQEHQKGQGVQRVHGYLGNQERQQYQQHPTKHHCKSSFHFAIKRATA